MNPFLSNNTSSNANSFLNFNSNNQNITNSNPFMTSTNNLNPFNSTINNNNNISNNNNDIFTRLKTPIISNNNSTFNNNNSSYNPFTNNNNNNSSFFNNNNNIITNNNSFISNNNYFNNNQNICTYYFGGVPYNLPKCTTFGKLPNTTFENNIKLFKEYDEKVKIGKMEYTSGRTENLTLCDQNFKDFSIEEIRANDYIKAKISFFDGWSDKNNLNLSFLGNNNNNVMNNNSFLNNNNSNSNPFLQNGNSSNIFNNNNSQMNGGILNNNINGSTNIFKSMFNNNQNNNSSFTGNLFNNNNNNNSSINPFLNNNNNNNNPFNNNNNNNIFSTNNPFNQNNNNTSINFLNNTNNNNNSNPFNNIISNNNNKQFTFGTNSVLGNNNTSNLFNNNNNNNNTFMNNNSNFSFNNNNNANIFNTSTKNPFDSCLNKNNINNNSNFNNNMNNYNNNIVNNIINNNQNIVNEKPFEEKIKDPAWFKRNVRIIDIEDPGILDDLDEIDKINLKVKEMLYFESKKEENNINKNNLKELTFNKIIMPSDEEIQNYYKTKSEKKNSKIEKLKEIINNNDSDNDNNSDNEMNDINRRWEPIALGSNNLKYRKKNIQNNINKKFDTNWNINRFDDLENNDTYKRNENNSSLNEYNKKEKISGFAEAAKILSNYDNNYVDFNSDNEQKEYILPTEREEFFKFNNMINNNKQTYLYSSINKHRNDDSNQIINIDNNNEFSNIISNNEDNQISGYNNKLEFNNNQKGIISYNNDNNSYESYSLNSNKNKNDIDIQMKSISTENRISNNNNNIEIEDFKNNKINIENNNINQFNYENNKNNYNFEASSTTDYFTANKNNVFSQKKEINNNITKEKIDDNECKIIYFGDCNSIQELKSPITIPILSLISNNNTDSESSSQDIFINLDLLIDSINKYIISINGIENKIILPSDEDIFLLINGKIYSKLTQSNIRLNDIEKKYDENKNYYYIIRYGFNLKQFPLLLENKDANLNYVIKPSIKDLLNPNNGYDLTKIENFEIYNKYGKIIFVDPIDLSGKIVINDIIKIMEGEIDLGDPRVDKLKAKVFLNFDFGDKLEGQFLENIKIYLKHKNSDFVKYENKVLEYNVNF